MSQFRTHFISQFCTFILIWSYPGTNWAKPAQKNAVLPTPVGRWIRGYGCSSSKPGSHATASSWADSPEESEASCRIVLLPNPKMQCAQTWVLPLLNKCQLQPTRTHHHFCQVAGPHVDAGSAVKAKRLQRFYRILNVVHGGFGIISQGQFLAR